MDWDMMKSDSRVFAWAILFCTIMTVIIGATIYHCGIKHDVMLNAQRNVNYCNTAIAVVNRVCDTAEKVFLVKEVEKEESN